MHPMRMIKHAAVKLIEERDELIFVGKNHAECFQKVKLAGRFHHGAVQGFVDDIGDFLTRKEAYIVARDAGQLPEGLSESYSALFSEELWSPQANAKHIYDEALGYIPIKSV